MATSLNTKIVLKNTTKMTLNERFTGYRSQAATASNFRQKLQKQRQTSSANLRLAQQMANRPTVIAALRLKKRSLQQRLGRKQSMNGNIKSRLNFTGKRFNNPSVQARLGSIRGRGGLRRGGFKSGISPLIKDRLGLPKSSGFKKKHLPNRRAGFGKRGNFRGNRQPRGGNRQQVQRSNLRNARGRGRGKSWWNNKTGGNVPTKQELDNQLDEYMAETKSSLDAQLEQYMAQG